jgi:hypothetical protein
VAPGDGKEDDDNNGVEAEEARDERDEVVDGDKSALGGAAEAEDKTTEISISAWRWFEREIIAIMEHDRVGFDEMEV